MIYPAFATVLDFTVSFPITSIGESGLAVELFVLMEAHLRGFGPSKS